MSSPRIISFRIAPEKVAQLDAIAKAMDRDRSYLLNEAVENYLGEQQRFAAMVEEGLEASRKGELIDHEDVGRMIDSWATERARGKKRDKAIKGYAALESA
jgi:predicted transcriptional regulator